MFYFVIVSIFVMYIALILFISARINKRLGYKYNFITFIDDWVRGSLSWKDKLSFFSYNLILLVITVVMFILLILSMFFFYPR